MRHTSSLLVTLQDSPSPPQIDMFASYRSFKGQYTFCTDWVICKTQIIRLRDVPERFFLPPMRILLSDGGFGKKCRRILQFCRRKPSNATAHRFEAFAHRWHFPKKRRHFLIPCHRKHPKTPAFARRSPVTAGTTSKQAEKELYFPTLSVPPGASAGICP